MESNLSTLMDAVERGDGSAPETLFAALYDELHRMARRELARAGSPASLGVTTLLHEAYLDVARREDGLLFPDRARFMGYAARVMRGLIIDHARNRCAQRQGGKFEITALSTNSPESIVDDRELSLVSEALDELAKSDPALAMCDPISRRPRGSSSKCLSSNLRTPKSWIIVVAQITSSVILALLWNGDEDLERT